MQLRKRGRKHMQLRINYSRQPQEYSKRVFLASDGGACRTRGKTPDTKSILSSYSRCLIKTISYLFALSLHRQDNRQIGSGRLDKSQWLRTGSILPITLGYSNMELHRPPGLIVHLVGIEYRAIPHSHTSLFRNLTSFS
jgi:hypothetical protein